MTPFTHPSFRGLFGVARRDITPPVEIYARSWGLAAHDQATSIHQPLTLTTLVIDGGNNEEPLAIIALDLGWWRSSQEEQVLATAVAEAGFSPAHSIITLSHTHAGPSFCPSEKDKPGGDLIAGYLQHVAAQITDALQEAKANLIEGVLDIISGSCPLASHRELSIDGRPVVGWNPNAVTDDTLLLGRITDRTGNCLATLINYACHPTILAWQNQTISPDYIGSMRKLVEEETLAPCLFLQGASGDIAARHQYTGDLEVVEKAGRVLGHSVLALWHSMLPAGRELGFTGIAESGAPLGLWETQPRSSREPDHFHLLPSEIPLPISPTLPSLAELEQQMKATSDRSLLERLQRFKLRRDAVGNGETTLRPFLSAKLGEIGLVAISDEAYSVMQTSLRKEAGAMPLFVITLANRNLGYLVPAELHSPSHYASRVSPYAPGSFEIVQQHLEENIRQLSE